MKKSFLLFIIPFLFACKNDENTVDPSSEEYIFSEIFTLDTENDAGLPQLNKLKFYQGMYNINAKDKERVKLAGTGLVKSVKKNYPGFFTTFNTKVQSGNPIQVESALSEACNILWATIVKDSAGLSTSVSRNDSLSDSDREFLAKLNSATDYKQAIELIETGQKYDLFKRAIKFDRRLGLESFRLPYENNEATQYLPDVDYTYKDMIPYWNFALAGNVAVVHDAILASELFIAVVLVIGVPLQDSDEKNLLKEKVINEITLKYKK